MTERADSDARKKSETFGGVEPHYGQHWPVGALWPDSAEHRQPPCPALPLPPARTESLDDAVRGAVFALAVVPVGVGLWLVLWKLEWIASIVACGAAVGAARLYLAGSAAGRSGSLTRRGARVVLAVTTATVLLAFLGTLWLKAAEYVGASPLALLFEPVPRDLLEDSLGNDPKVGQDLLGGFLRALLFSAAGCFFPLRQLFIRARRT